MEVVKKVFELLQFDGPKDITFVDCDGVYVKHNVSGTVLGGNGNAQLGRAAMLLAKQVTEGKTEFEIKQTPQFETLGAMLDMSRNAVLKVEAVKEYLTYLAALGFNMFMLYTEDTYEIPEYPRFGYARGRYTLAELQEIDRFADTLGIEVVPCIQTLGHMEQYLRWTEAASEVQDTPTVLLCEEEKTYTLIEAMIRTMRKAFHGKRIHIGMDEAWDVGLGNYLNKHGYQNRFEILNKHLQRVLRICEKYEFQPIIWSDMFFKLGSKTGDYRDVNNHIPPEKAALIPNVEMAFWDYFQTDGAVYEALLNAHKEMGKRVMFAGGIWLWGRALPDLSFTFRSMTPALEKCIACGIPDVVANVWGDMGSQCNYFFSLLGLPLFSEYCYRGQTCTMEDIKSMMDYVIQFPYDDATAISLHNWNFAEGGTQTPEYYTMGTPIFWADLLYDLPSIPNYQAYLQHYQEGLERLKQSTPRGQWKPYYEYAVQMFDITVLKCKLLSELRAKYRQRDMAYLSNLCDHVLPKLKQSFQRMHLMHRDLWMHNNKVFGWEVLDMRYGAVSARLDYAIEQISLFCQGSIDAIDELEFEALKLTQQNLSDFRDVTSTSVIF